METTEHEEMQGHGEEGSSSKTFFLPPESGCGDCEPGEVIQLKVVGKTPEGELEVEYVGGDKGDDWKSDLKQHMASTKEPQPQDTYGS